MKAVDFAVAARTDLQEVEDWISRDSPERAEVFLERLMRLLDRLADRPLIGRPRPEIREGVRSMVHGRYVIFYRPTSAGIIVYRVLHGRRDLGNLDI